MERRDARQFQPAATVYTAGWNIVELESRRQLHRTVDQLIQLANDAAMTRSEMREEMLLGVATFGNRLATQLVRSLNRDDDQERQSIVWLLTLLGDQETIPLLKQMSFDRRLRRAVRLSAALALAGMGATREMSAMPQQRLYNDGRLYVGEG